MKPKTPGETYEQAQISRSPQEKGRYNMTPSLHNNLNS